MGDGQVDGWVWPENVQPMLRLLSGYIGYAFDDSDWQAVEAALPETDADDHDAWYAYPLLGSPPLTVALAQNVGAEPVAVRVSGARDAVLSARISTVLDALADMRGSG
jgi:hypothetical protein